MNLLKKINKYKLMIIFTLLFLLLTSCAKTETKTETHELQIYECSFIVNEFPETIYTLSEEESLYVCKIVSNAHCIPDIYKCICIYTFIVGDEKWQYSPEDGVFNNYEANRAFKITGEENEHMMKIIESYM